MSWRLESCGEHPPLPQMMTGELGRVNANFDRSQVGDYVWGRVTDGSVSCATSPYDL